MSLRMTVPLACALALAVSSAALALQTGEKAPPFKLADQFGKTWDSSELKGDAVVVVAANADSGRDMGPWVDKLKENYGDTIKLIGLMDQHGLPGFVRGIARYRIRKETKDPLLIDFKGDVAKAYTVTDKHPVVVVIDKEGVVRSVEATKYTDKAYQATTAAIDTALKTGNKQ